MLDENYFSNNEDKVYLIDKLKELEEIKSYGDFRDYLEKFKITNEELGLLALRMLHYLFAEGRSKYYNGKYDPKELLRGLEVEMEHTSCPLISLKIAMDHLAELPDYYTRLDKMEEEAEV